MSIGLSKSDVDYLHSQTPQINVHSDDFERGDAVTDIVSDTSELNGNCECKVEFNKNLYCSNTNMYSGELPINKPVENCTDTVKAINAANQFASVKSRFFRCLVM